jgi:alkaline phosphatase D
MAAASTTDFDTRDLGDMVAVGATDTQGVRFWIRTSRPGPHVLEIWNATSRHGGTLELAPPPGADGTTSVRYPDDVPGAEPLAPITAYAYRILRGDEELGTGRFETAPTGRADAPARFAFAATSCHQPFAESGELDRPSLALLEVLDGALRARDVKRVFLMGDQMYADYPIARSLFEPPHFATVAPPGRQSIHDCTREEIRALYQRRYRTFWSIEGFRNLLANYPCSAILDDHELSDNFGSAPEHAFAKWAAIHAGGLDAFHDYQGLLRAARPLDGARPSYFDFTERYADVGVYCLDVRSARHHDGESLHVYRDEQLVSLSRFLAASADLSVVLLISSVPLAVFPRWVASFGTRLLGRDHDAADRWNHPDAKRSRQRLTEVLFEHQRAHPDQRLILLGGDIHIGCAVQFVWRDREVRPMYQLVSSAVSNLIGRPRRKLAKSARQVDAHLGGEDDDLWERVTMMHPASSDESTNPCEELNVGVVSMEREATGRLAVRLELVSCDGDPPAARTMFASEPL